MRWGRVEGRASHESDGCRCKDYTQWQMSVFLSQLAYPSPAWVAVRLYWYLLRVLLLHLTTHDRDAAELLSRHIDFTPQAWQIPHAIALWKIARFLTNSKAPTLIYIEIINMDGNLMCSIYHNNANFIQLFSLIACLNFTPNFTLSIFLIKHLLKSSTYLVAWQFNNKK